MSLALPIGLLDHFLGCLCALGTMRLSGCCWVSSQAIVAYCNRTSGQVAGPAEVSGLDRWDIFLAPNGLTVIAPYSSSAKS